MSANVTVAMRADDALITSLFYVKVFIFPGRKSTEGVSPISLLHFGSRGTLEHR